MPVALVKCDLHGTEQPTARFAVEANFRYPRQMLHLAKVNEVVSKAASAAIQGGAGIQRVDSEPTTDSEGREALDVTIVLKRGSAGKISGDSALNMLVSIERALRAAKDERFPIVSFVTEEELEESSGDTES